MLSLYSDQETDVVGNRVTSEKTASSLRGQKRRERKVDRGEMGVREKEEEGEGEGQREGWKEEGKEEREKEEV